MVSVRRAALVVADVAGVDQGLAVGLDAKGQHLRRAVRVGVRGDLGRAHAHFAILGNRAHLDAARPCCDSSAPGKNCAAICRSRTRSSSSELWLPPTTVKRLPGT